MEVPEPRSGCIRAVDGPVGEAARAVQVTLAELVEAVAAETEDAREMATVVNHLLRASRATWARRGEGSGSRMASRWSARTGRTRRGGCRPRRRDG